MLVLSRKQQQDIVIGDDIKITVLKVKGNTVRLGIEAPKDVRVVRGELPREEDSQIANVTVVFNDTIDREPGNGSREVEVLKFSNHSQHQSCSISYRQLTPPALRHNRLKQIVQEVTGRENVSGDE